MSEDNITRCPECGSTNLTAYGMANATYAQDEKGNWELIESEVPDEFVCNDCKHEWNTW